MIIRKIKFRLKYLNPISNEKNYQTKDLMINSKK